jgi:hypothetical protein
MIGLFIKTTSQWKQDKGFLTSRLVKFLAIRHELLESKPIV